MIFRLSLAADVVSEKTHLKIYHLKKKLKKLQERKIRESLGIDNLVAKAVFDYAINVLNRDQKNTVT